ncbi:MAG TPA: hypothetical protein VGI99_11455, partial [Gemmataceae bacterium]
MKPKTLIDPWIGKKYESAPFGKRLMLLGESMYTSAVGEYPVDELQKLIGRVTEKGETRWRFYGRVFHVMTGKKRSTASVEDVKSLWDGVLFHQYIQEPIRGKPRHRPSGAMWQAAPAYLRAVLECYQPGAIIAFGKGVWNGIVSAGLVESKGSGFTLLNQETPIPVIHLNHPASNGFSA